MQKYHANAKTNAHIRKEIQEKKLTIARTAQKYGISETTVKTWRKRDYQHDKPSTPLTVKYSLSEVERAVVVFVRKTMWIPLDEVCKLLFPDKAYSLRSSVYRTFQRNGINKVPQKQKDKAKKFKEYSPGYLHVDVTYLPKLEGSRKYLFVAIDRATRLVYYRVYDTKCSKSSEDFLKRCIEFYPFKITHTLTDNGLEFTTRLLKSKKKEQTKVKIGRFEKLCQLENIDHRKTRPFTPKTNGMVEKMNDIIKSNTVKIRTYKSTKEMDEHLAYFLKHYNLHRSHGSLRRELRVHTPFEALEKWYELEPDLFHRHPQKQRQIINNIYSVFNIERVET